MSRRASCAFGLLLLACGGTPAPPASPAADAVVLSVVGTNDLHGRVHALPVFGGYLDTLRAARADDGAVILLDGGDMFQGTLESNLAEGAPVVAAYQALGYDAVTIGNHEFDYGPEGPASVPQEQGDDPRGALRARARGASFPFLTANLLQESGERVAWENAPPSVLLERAGVAVGVIGVTTEETLRTTIAANVADLRMAPLAERIAREAEALRGRGAQVILVAAHAGGECEAFDDPDDLSSCDPSAEIFAVARALPAGAVDVIVGGHTHEGVAHVVNGIAIIESYAYGRAFGRVDLVVAPDGGVLERRVHAPRELCATGEPSAGDCVPGDYEGRAVTPDPEGAELVAPAIEAARGARERPLGVTLTAPFTQTRYAENPLGNLFTDLMRVAHPEADVALTNGGGLRADLPSGPLTYGALYLAFPFDNRFATLEVTGAQLAAIVRENLEDDGSFFSLSGVRAVARCEGGALEVTLTREDGAPIAPDARLVLVTTDYVATGGDGFEAADVTVHEARTVRDGMSVALEAVGGQLAPGERFDPGAPRVFYEGSRPLRCR